MKTNSVIGPDVFTSYTESNMAVAQGFANPGLQVALVNNLFFSVVPNIFGSSILTFSCEHSGSWNFEVVHRFLWIMCTAVLTLLIRSADCFIWRPSSYRAVNTFHLGYKNRSFYDISGTSRCLFSDKYKTHKYSVGRAYNRWMLNCWGIT